MWKILQSKETIKPCSHDENLQSFLEAAGKVNLTFNKDKLIFSKHMINTYILGYQILHGLIQLDPQNFLLLLS